MIDLDHTYRRLARPWTPEELATRYRDAEERGARATAGAHEQLARPIGILASAIPPSATLNVAIHALHLLPRGETRGVSQAGIASELVDTAGKNAGAALHHAHRALEADGVAHGYTANEWLPVIYDAAAPLLGSSRLEQEPPSLVRHTHEAVRWLSTSIACLDEDSREAAAAITDMLARLLVVCVFAHEACTGSE